MSGLFGVTLNVGEISSGTMRREDIILAYTNALDLLKERLALLNNPETRDLIGRIDNLLGEIEKSERKSQEEGFYETEEAGYYLEDLRELLEEFLPPYTYLGGLEGDPACIGVWVDLQSIEEGRRWGELESGDSTPDLPTESGYFLTASDHGNIELYEWREDSRWHSVWSLV